MTGFCSTRSVRFLERIQKTGGIGCYRRSVWPGSSRRLVAIAILNETATTVAAFRPIREPAPNFFQNHAPGNNNYELVVREGNALRHYWHYNGQWNREEASFGSNISGDPAMFQNHAPGNNNYELVVREGNALRHYWFDGQWNRRDASFGSNVNGLPAMFQNHAPGNNNYELVVREGNALRHYWHYNGQWNSRSSPFAQFP